MGLSIRKKFEVNGIIELYEIPIFENKARLYTGFFNNFIQVSL